MSDDGRVRGGARVGRTGARFPAHVEFDEPDPTDPPDQPAAAVVDGEHALVGRTGARFNSRARRTRRTARRRTAEDAAVREIAGEAPSPSWRHVPAADDFPTGPIAVTAADGSDEDDRVWVRPYVRTHGRTRTRRALALETLVSVPDPCRPITDPEHVAIAEICVEPRSVAEVAARLRVPLGVARVLIEDMAGVGLLVVHDLPVGRSGTPDLDVMARVLDGLHRL